MAYLATIEIKIEIIFTPKKPSVFITDSLLGGRKLKSIPQVAPILCPQFSVHANMHRRCCHLVNMFDSYTA
jgi:hypothetical protein